MSSSTVKYNSILIIDKMNSNIAGSGFGCNNTYTDTISKIDINYLDNRLKILYKKYVESIKPANGYIFLKEKANEFLFYSNFKHWLIFINVNTNNLEEFFGGFVTLIKKINEVLDINLDVQSNLKLVNKLIFTEYTTFECENCQTKQVCTNVIGMQGLYNFTIA